MVTERRGKNRETLPAIPFPMAHFAGGKLSAYNPVFAEIFLRDDETRRPTLAQFLGREGMRRLREQGWQEEPGTDGMLWRLVLSLGEKDRRFYDIEVRWVDGVLQLFLLDLTEKNDRAAELHAAQTWSTLTFQGNPSALALVDGGTIVQANQSFAAMFGFSDALEASGRRYEKHVAAKYRTAVSDLHAKLLSGSSEGAVAEGIFLKKDRSAFPASESARVIEHEGRPCLLVSVRDLTADKENERRVDERVHGWEQSEEIMWSVGYPETKEEFGNRLVEHVLRLLGLEFGLLYAGADKEGIMKAAAVHAVPSSLAGALAELRSSEGLLGFIQKTREPIAVPLEDYPAHLPHRTVMESAGVRTIAAVPLLGEGTVHAVLVAGSIRMRVHCDLTVLRRLSRDLGERFAATLRYASLREHTSRIEQIVNRLPEIVYCLRPSGEFLFLSDAVREITGYNPDDFYRSADLWRNVLHPDDRSLYGNRIAGQRDEGLQLEYKLLPKGKASYRRLLDTVRYIRDSEGRLTAIIGSVRELEGG